MPLCSQFMSLLLGLIEAKRRVEFKKKKKRRVEFSKKGDSLNVILDGDRTKERGYSF